MISARAASAVLAAWYWLVVAFLFAPLVVVVLFSLNDAEVSILPIRALSGRWYAMLMKDQTVLHALGNSLIVAVAAVVVSVLLGAPLAIGAHRHGGKVGRALVGFALAPMMIPALILGVLAADAPECVERPAVASQRDAWPHADLPALCRARLGRAPRRL